MNKFKKTAAIAVLLTSMSSNAMAGDSFNSLDNYNETNTFNTQDVQNTNTLENTFVGSVDGTVSGTVNGTNSLHNDVKTGDVHSTMNGGGANVNIQNPRERGVKLVLGGAQSAPVIGSASGCTVVETNNSLVGSVNVLGAVGYTAPMKGRYLKECGEQQERLDMLNGPDVTARTGVIVSHAVENPEFKCGLQAASKGYNAGGRTPDQILAAMDLDQVNYDPNDATKTKCSPDFEQVATRVSAHSAGQQNQLCASGTRAGKPPIPVLTSKGYVMSCK